MTIREADVKLMGIKRIRLRWQGYRDHKPLSGSIFAWVAARMEPAHDK